MAIITQSLVVFVFWSYCLGDGESQSISYEGFCAFPCSYQERTYERQGIDVTPVGNFSSSDPTFVSIVVNGVFRRHICYARSGQFFVTRRVKIEGNDTVWEYRCKKDVRYDKTSDILLWYTTEWKTFLNNPTICDVCDGKLDLMIIIKDVMKGTTVVRSILIFFITFYLCLC